MQTAVKLSVHSFPVINLVTNLNYDQASGMQGFVPEAHLLIQAIKDMPGGYHCEATVKVTEERCPTAPYFIHITCITSIAALDLLPEPPQKQAVATLASTLLFPAIRELVLTLTARQPWGIYPITLPNDAPLPESGSSAKKTKAKKKSSS